MMNHFPFHIGDYIKSTPHLSNAADLCYRRLIELYYDTEKPIGLDLDIISNRIRCDGETVKKVIAEFFTETKAGFKNKRCDAEIRQYYIKVKANRINGKLGGRPRKTQSVSKTQSVNLANPTITQTNLNQNQNQNHKPVNQSRAFALPDWVPLEAWNGFVEMRRKSKGAFTERAKELLVGELLKLTEAGGDAAKILDQSTANGWKGVFPLKVNGNGGNGKAQGAPWWSSNEGITAKAAELHIESRKGESWNDLKARVNQAMGAV